MSFLSSRGTNNGKFFSKNLKGFSEEDTAEDLEALIISIATAIVDSRVAIAIANATATTDTTDAISLNTTSSISIGSSTAGAVTIESGTGNNLSLTSGNDLNLTTTNRPINISATGSSLTSDVAITAQDRISLTAVGGPGTSGVSIVGQDEVTITSSGIGSDIVINPENTLIVQGPVNTTQNYQVDGNQVITNRQSGILNLVLAAVGTNAIIGADTADVNSRLGDISSKINDILAVLRTHGLIET